MVEAAEAVQHVIAGRQRQDLDGDLTLRLALVRAIEILGEAASRVSPEGKSSVLTIPWVAIIGMRNRLSHAYFVSTTTSSGARPRARSPRCSRPCVLSWREGTNPTAIDIEPAVRRVFKRAVSSVTTE
jgi:hypothetical protein